MMKQRITALRPQRRNADVVDMHIDGEFCAAVACIVIANEGLHTGDAIDEAQLERVLAANEHWRAKQSALSLLSARPRAEGELEERLRRKGFSDGAVQYALAEVDRLGFLDDEVFAEAWVRDRLRLRPRGTRALVHELGRRRVAADTARAVIARVMSAENVTDDALCLAAAERWVDTRLRASGATPSDDEMRRAERRLSAYLSRRGYHAGAVRHAIDAVLIRRSA